jgi:hypothetical protein
MELLSLCRFVRLSYDIFGFCCVGVGNFDGSLNLLNMLAAPW